MNIDVVSTIANLSDAHYRLLSVDSLISDAEIIATGFCSVDKFGQLRAFGFSRTQAKTVPGLLVPMHGVDGLLYSHQFRSNDPYNPKLKYVSPPKSRNRLSVSPQRFHDLANPDIPLLFTEGIRKRCAIDSAITIGTNVVPISLVGVWGWRCTNEDGGKVAVPDFESIALNGRTVYLCFDSDAMTKKEVHEALSRFSRFLSSKQARVKVLYLPHGDDDSKTGADDYLAAGHSLAEMLTLTNKPSRLDDGHMDGGRDPKTSIVADELSKRYYSELRYDNQLKLFIQYGAKEHGIWSHVPDEAIQLKVAHDLKDFYKRGFEWSRVSGAINMLKAALHLELPSLSTDIVPYANGVLNTSSISFHPHVPDRFCTWSLGYEYSEKADCQVIKDWLLEAMEQDEGRVKIIRAFMNAVLRGRFKIRRGLKSMT